MNVEDIAKTMVENFEYSLIFKLTKEIANEDIFETQQKVNKSLNSKPDTESLFREAKTYFINRAIDDKRIAQELVAIPELLNLSLELNDLGLDKERTIALAKETSLITLLLYLIPSMVIGPTITPQDFRQQGVNTLVEYMLSSEKKRNRVFKAVEKEISNHKMGKMKLESKSILKGYKMKPSKTDGFTASTIALILIIATDLPFIHDEVLELPLRSLRRETTSYILAMHAYTALKKYIAGIGRRKPFDWPITGDKKSCTQVLNLLEILRDITLNLRTCPKFAIELMSQKMKMSHEDYIVLLIDELVLHYEETLKNRRRRGKNKQLKQFIKFIRDDKRVLSRRLLETSDIGASFAKELRDYKLKAKSDHRTDISPENRYLENLRSLDGILKIKRRSERFSIELVEDLRPVFDSISEVVKKNESDLREDIFKFTDALCFQSCFQILEYVNLDENLTDLPWISRFIAEEAVRSSISSGELHVLGEKHRTERIIAAYLGGLSYIILQSHIADS